MCATCIRSWRAFQSGGGFVLGIGGFGLQNRVEGLFALGDCFAQSDDFLECGVAGAEAAVGAFCG